MVNFIFLALLLFVIQFGISGGWYEVIVMYPRWRKDVTPATLKQKLDETGQLLANKRYWPFFSPLAALLSIINIVLAYQCTNEARTAWLWAAIITLLIRIATFAYFAPTMVHKFQRPENINVEKLKSSVRMWLLLSPVRTAFELIAWALGIWAIFQMKCI